MRIWGPVLCVISNVLPAIPQISASPRRLRKCWLLPLTDTCMPTIAVSCARKVDNSRNVDGSKMLNMHMNNKILFVNDTKYDPESLQRQGWNCQERRGRTPVSFPCQATRPVRCIHGPQMSGSGPYQHARLRRCRQDCRNKTDPTVTRSHPRTRKPIRPDTVIAANGLQISSVCCWHGTRDS